MTCAMWQVTRPATGELVMEKLGRTLVIGLFPLLAGCASASSDDDVGDGTENAIGASALAREYQGTVNGAKVMMRLAVSGGNVTGSYFYVGQITKGETIALKGKISGNRLSLDETVDGKKTGSFTGTVDRNGKATGTWTGEGSGAFTLDPVKGDAIAVTREIEDFAQAAEPAGTLDKCMLKASYVEVFGL